MNALCKYSKHRTVRFIIGKEEVWLKCYGQFEITTNGLINAKYGTRWAD